MFEDECNDDSMEQSLSLLHDQYQQKTYKISETSLANANSSSSRFKSVGEMDNTALGDKIREPSIDNKCNIEDKIPENHRDLIKGNINGFQENQTSFSEDVSGDFNIIKSRKQRQKKSLD